jgi:Holliday junction resolvase RusA-like endonuclease
MQTKPQVSSKSSSELLSLKVIVPWAIFLPRKTKAYKRVPLSANWYRNAQHFESNSAKTLFKEIVSDQIRGKILKTPVEVTYKAYKPSRRHSDKMNQYSIVSKFLFDCMTQEGVWVDDSDEYVYTEHLLPSEVDSKTNINDLITVPDALTLGNGMGRIEVTFKTVQD